MRSRRSWTGGVATLTTAKPLSSWWALGEGGEQEQGVVMAGER